MVQQLRHSGKEPELLGQEPVWSREGRPASLSEWGPVAHHSGHAARYSALRTGKLDWNGGVLWDDAAAIIKTNPELKYVRYLPDTTFVMYMRTDKADLPFSKLKVRQALAMAVDQNTLKNVFYGGNAEILAWPIIDCKEYHNAYVPLDQLPADVQELYSYNPTKAKQLLTEAGYPTGFTTKILCYNSSVYIDLLSQIQAMWAKIGVNLQLDAVDYAVWRAKSGTRAYDEMEYWSTSGIGTYYKMINFSGAGNFNGSYVNDPTVEAARLKMLDYVGVEGGEAKMDALHRELMPYLLKQCYVITRPSPYTYAFWQPWVKGYQGEHYTGYYNVFATYKYTWLDVNLRKQMIGK